MVLYVLPTHLLLPQMPSERASARSDITHLVSISMSCKATGAIAALRRWHLFQCVLLLFQSAILGAVLALDSCLSLGSWLPWSLVRTSCLDPARLGPALEWGGWAFTALAYSIFHGGLVERLPIHYLLLLTILKSIHCAIQATTVTRNENGIFQANYATPSRCDKTTQPYAPPHQKSSRRKHLRKLQERFFGRCLLGRRQKASPIITSHIKAIMDSGCTWHAHPHREHFVNYVVLFFLSSLLSSRRARSFVRSSRPPTAVTRAGLNVVAVGRDPATY
jgi:hypothetical protein